MQRTGTTTIVSFVSLFVRLTVMKIDILIVSLISFSVINLLFNVLFFICFSSFSLRGD